MSGKRFSDVFYDSSLKILFGLFLGLSMVIIYSGFVSGGLSIEEIVNTLINWTFLIAVPASFVLGLTTAYFRIFIEPSLKGQDNFFKDYKNFKGGKR